MSRKIMRKPHITERVKVARRVIERIDVGRAIRNMVRLSAPPPCRRKPVQPDVPTKNDEGGSDAKR